MMNAETGRMPRRRTAKAAALRRISQHERQRGSAMTKIDDLVEIAKKLKEARALGERCSDRALLYFLDMTIVHVCDSLESSQEPEDAADAGLNLAHASL
jgi:hypothetical protein